MWAPSLGKVGTTYQPVPDHDLSTKTHDESSIFVHRSLNTLAVKPTKLQNKGHVRNARLHSALTPGLVYKRDIFFPATPRHIIANKLARSKENIHQQRHGSYAGGTEVTARVDGLLSGHVSGSPHANLTSTPVTDGPSIIVPSTIEQGAVAPSTGERERAATYIGRESSATPSFMENCTRPFSGENVDAAPSIGGRGFAAAPSIGMYKHYSHVTPANPEGRFLQLQHTHRQTSIMDITPKPLYKKNIFYTASPWRSGQKEEAIVSLHTVPSCPGTSTSVKYDTKNPKIPGYRIPTTMKKFRLTELACASQERGCLPLKWLFLLKTTKGLVGARKI